MARTVGNRLTDRFFLASRLRTKDLFGSLEERYRRTASAQRNDRENSQSSRVAADTCPSIPDKLLILSIPSGVHRVSGVNKNTGRGLAQGRYGPRGEDSAVGKFTIYAHIKHRG